MKYNFMLKPSSCSGRSREGAWIEMLKIDYRAISDARRSREGAWIEIN